MPTIPCPTPIEKDTPFPSAYIKRDAYTPPSIIYICTAALCSQVAAPAKSGNPERISACHAKLAIPIPYWVAYFYRALPMQTHPPIFTLGAGRLLRPPGTHPQVNRISCADCLQTGVRSGSRRSDSFVGKGYPKSNPGIRSSLRKWWQAASGQIKPSVSFAGCDRYPGWTVGRKSHP